VRRLAPGERVDLTDGAGLLAECEVVAARPGSGELDVAVLARRSEPEPRCPVIVVQAIMKGDRGELAVELMTEVGIDTIVPWAAERCVARWRPDREDKALHRWRSSAREAAKQSRRSRFPEVTGQAQTAEVISLVRGAALAVLLDPHAGPALAAVLRPDAGPDAGPSAGSAARSGAGLGAGEIVLIVGPEGGVSPRESADLTAAGAIKARLGPSVLRGSTAGAVAGALVLSASGRWT
jgi:16S rRNA (uracil1498-N3)-methyltransferase